jgi:hypothetical protein
MIANQPRFEKKAVISAVLGAPEPAAAVADLLRAVETAKRRSG